jgi:hypothetical protein
MWPYQAETKWVNYARSNVDKHGSFAPGLAARRYQERGRRETPCASSTGLMVEAAYVAD